MMNKYKNISALWKGVVIGGTMLVPGVSGGSMAMLLGIYDRLISSVSSFFKDIKKNFIFLFFFVVGAGAGMLIFAKPLLALIEDYNKPMMYFFTGAVAGGIPMIYRHAKAREISWKSAIYILIGFAVVMIFAFLPEDIFTGSANSTKTNMFMQLLSGFIAAVALVLPGISVSYMLLLMGMYDKTMVAISELDILFLLPMVIGLMAGIILITKFLEKVMNNYPEPTYLIILGFVIGSIVQVFPGLPDDFDWIFCSVLAIVGYYIIHSISKVDS